MPKPEAINTQPTFFLDCEHPEIARFAAQVTTCAHNQKEQAIQLYYAVRDGIKYNPYALTFEMNDYKASAVLSKKEGFCVQKAVLLAATARACHIPALLGFSDVRNHLSSRRLREILQTDIFFFHGYVQLHIEGRWVKATPAFDAVLCEKLRIFPLEFDGEHDSIFHQFDREGKMHMEYVRDHGSFTDLPFDMMIDTIRSGYPHLVSYFEKGRTDGDLHSEVTSES